MGPFRFRPAVPSSLPLPAPRPDGTGWPDRPRASFASGALLELALRAAFEVEAHAVADALVERVVPRLHLPVADEDRPFLVKVLEGAARTGAGLAAAERGQPAVPEGHVDRTVAAALWEARRQLPAMPPEQAGVAAFVLLAGFWVARQGPEAVDRLEV